jgi:iron complex outermembrane receptor protein
MKTIATDSPASSPAKRRLLLILASLPWAAPALASDDFLALPLEDLLKIEISSASRKMQQVQGVAAAVFVISRDDIERSGARTIPEALRLAPGVDVARIGNNRWAVSVRGFNGRFANKLLVLKDGRSVYSPLFSGVIWEAEDAILGDIERIEVIRGPGAAMWGSNAVNGVINIISRSAADTQGSEIVASTATDEPGALTVRHGFAIGDGHLRISAKGFHLDPGRTANGDKGNDDWTATRIGLRGDWPAADGGRWMLAGETYKSRADDRLDRTLFASEPQWRDISQLNSGSNLSLRRELPMADGGQTDWQISAETTDLDASTVIREQRQTFAGEIQRRIPFERHELIVGASYKYSTDEIKLLGAQSVSLAVPERSWRIASVFISDDYALVPDRLRLSAGVRLDHDNWSGTQAQPNVRLAWTPSSETTWWTSLARAARTPSRGELDIPITFAATPAIPPFVPAVRALREPPPSGTLKAEKVTTFELGFRQRVTSEFSLDLVGFSSDYSHLASLVTEAPRFVPPALVIAPVTSANAGSGRTRGFEVAANWQATPDWRIQGNYSRTYLNIARTSDPAAAAARELVEGHVPRHQASLRSSWTLKGGHNLDLWLKYVSHLSKPDIAAYTVLDLRYAYRIGKDAEVAIIGQNLLDERHPEFASDYLAIQQTEVSRSVMVKGTWRF